MLVVIDKSAHADSRLEEFLSASSSNRAVLPQFFGAESYAGSPLKNITLSIAILSKYPNQVRLLRGSDQIARIGKCDPNHRFDLVDWQLSKHFPDFCRDIEQANAGDPERLKHVEALGKQATDFLNEFADWAPEFRGFIVEVKASANADFLAALRSDSPYPIGIGFGMFAQMLAFAKILAREAEPPLGMPNTPAEANDYFLFRFAVAAFLLIFDRIRDDSVEGIKGENIRNDLIDVAYATVATYFDGLFTNDRRMEYIHGEARYLIENIFPYCTNDAIAGYVRAHGGSARS